MPKFVIEREIPGAGKLSGQELHAISQKSCGVLQTMGPKIQWLQSYVTDDKIYCVYIAPDEETGRRPERGGLLSRRHGRRWCGCDGRQRHRLRLGRSCLLGLRFVRDDLNLGQVGDVVADLVERPDR